MSKAVWLKRVAIGALATSLVGALGGCGGGGDDGPPPPALSFSPEQVSLTTTAGSTFTVTATAGRTYSQMVYVKIIDQGGVIVPTVSLTYVSPTVYQATFTLQSGLSLGPHVGRFEVHLCTDPACNSDVEGSPSYLPYAITIQ